MVTKSEFWASAPVSASTMCTCGDAGVGLDGKEEWEGGGQG